MNMQLVLISVVFFTLCNNNKEFVIMHNTNATSVVIQNLQVEQRVDTTTNFNNYWREFRQSVLSLDSNKIYQLTNLPIETRGSLDDDPVIKYSKNKFWRVFNLFLNQWTGIEANESEKDFIKKTQLPIEKPSAKTMRVGDMIFKLSGKEWKLYFLYLNDETVDAASLIK